MSFTEYVKQFLPKGGLAKGVAILVSGTVLASSITILASPILTRLYTPDEFGLLALFNSFLEIFGIIVCWRYHLAIPLPGEELTARSLVVLSTSILAIMVFIICVVIWWFGDSLLRWAQAEALEAYIWFLPAGILFFGLFHIFNHWAIRTKQYQSTAQANFLQEGSTVALQLGLGLGKFGTLGLLIGRTIGQAAGSLYLGKRLNTGSDLSIQGVTAPLVYRSMTTYKRFPIYSTWSALFNTTSKQFPVLLLAFFFGPMFAGFFALGRRVIQTPMRLVGQAIAQVFFSEASIANRTGDVKPLVEKVFAQLLQFGLPPILIIGLAAPELFSLVFGSEWREAGVYTQWLAPFIFMVFVTAPVGTLPSILGNQRQELLFQTFLLVGRVAALTVGGLLSSPRLAVGLYAAISALAWFWFLIWIMHCVGLEWRTVMAGMVREGLKVLPWTLPLVVMKIVQLSGPDPNPTLELYIVIAALVGGALMAGQIIRRLGQRIHAS